MQVTNRQRKIRLDTNFLKRVGQTTLARAGVNEAECVLMLVGDRAMTRLNRQYRGKATTTDVLSFPMREGRLRRSRRICSGMWSSRLKRPIDRPERRDALFETSWPRC